jgi:hypothetical protein
MNSAAGVRCGWEAKQADDFAPRSFLITLPDGMVVDLGLENIRRITREYFGAAGGLPRHARRAVALGRCSVCPKRGQPDHCHALEPLLPLLRVFEKRPSYTPVHISLEESPDRPPVEMETTLQDALAVTCMMSLLGYCGIGKKYRRYFNGARLLMKGREMADILLANMSWEAQGDRDRLERNISLFDAEFRAVILCQVDRMRCLSPSDALLNAYVEAHLPALLLSMTPKQAGKPGYRLPRFPR